MSKKTSTSGFLIIFISHRSCQTRPSPKWTRAVYSYKLQTETIISSQSRPYLDPYPSKHLCPSPSWPAIALLCLCRARKLRWLLPYFGIYSRRIDLDFSHVPVLVHVLFFVEPVPSPRGHYEYRRLILERWFYSCWPLYCRPSHSVLFESFFLSSPHQVVHPKLRHYLA